MTKLIIQEELIHSLTRELAPLVISITGWDLNLDSLQCQVVPKEQGYEAILEGRLHALGIPVAPGRDLVSRVLEYLVENNVMAAYEPLTNTLMVVRENVDDSNLDGLKLILAHELTHRAQHVHHPQVFERINQALREVFREMGKTPPNTQKMLAYFEEVKPLMTLIESHANFVQGELCRRYFPQAQIERHFTLPVLLFRVLGYGKTAQYTEGLPQVSRAMQQGNVDGLFRGQADV